MAFFKTHYYGGIKKYQWTATPLAMHGVVFNKNNEKIEVCIGEDENDPILAITDLLPHLAKDQVSKSLAEGIDGETLNVLVGHRPIGDDKTKDKVKLHVLKILSEKYYINAAYLGQIFKKNTGSRLEIISMGYELSRL